MNTKQTVDYIAQRVGQNQIMLAYAQGADIEYRPLGSTNKWYPALDPAWNWDTIEYRAKLVPQKVTLYREIGGPADVFTYRQMIAQFGAPPFKGYECVEFVEVM